MPLPWDVPITNYLFFYVVGGAIAFALCFYQRFFVFVAVPALLWACISDLHFFFYSYVGDKYAGPESDYTFIVVFFMLLAFFLTGLGVYLNWRKNKFNNSFRF